MADPDLLDRAVAAFVAATAEQREAAVALDRYRIGAWLRERGHADLARAVEHGDHLDDDQPAIPSLRLTMAARDMHMQRADDAEAEVKRLIGVIARVEMLPVKTSDGHELEVCPFCLRRGWAISRPDQWARHFSRCEWVLAQEVSRG